VASSPGDQQRVHGTASEFVLLIPDVAHRLLHCDERVRAADEIIVSTLPRGVSKWSRRDLISQIRRLGLPVTAIVPVRDKHLSARIRRSSRCRRGSPVPASEDLAVARRAAPPEVAAFVLRAGLDLHSGRGGHESPAQRHLLDWFEAERDDASEDLSSGGLDAEWIL
jgi:hypothetical protein